MTSLIKTLRTPRLFGMAIFDLVGSIVGTEFVTYKLLGFKKYTGAILAVPLGIVVHKVLNIDTELNRKLGINS
jgi:hypothetical protein